MYTVKIGLDAHLHDEFVAASGMPNLLQTSKWATIKSSWKSEIIGFYQDDRLVASSMVLIRPLPLGFTMLYIPRGILMDYTDKALLKFVLLELRKFGKSQKALFIKFDPAYKFDDAYDIMTNLTNAGVEYTGRTTEMHDTIQPRYNAVIYKEDFSEESLDKKTRQFIRKARNSYPEIVFGGKELVPVFAELMKKTEARKNVSLRNAEYYTKLLDTYGSDAFITLVKFDMAKVKKDMEANVAKIKDNQTKAKNEKRLKVLSEELAIAEKNISDISAFIAEKGEIIPVAGTLSINAFGAAETLYAGTDTAFQKYYPSYLVWFETIQHAFKNGANTLNMGGLENSLSEKDGLLKFKKHFNPRIEEYVGEFDLPVNKLLYKVANALYKRQKTKH
ncbi:peptidoglycan bridge formation glycyltransferase FemA/FemB family protein [Lactococcus ileimucosae]|uniref:peptidoglycan bridge formation glycyltransferase FemA/FemB family protein n=1 Tax=Lactococcus ileimucosae TaxID=2941329 RepID=UPI002043AF91|nr:peptidoglycan bridge formation glycyltransferase FemA/FemB family protein [Lactococcus ileimucosae]